MKLDWDDLRDELDRSNLEVDITPISVSGHPAILVVAPIAPVGVADSLRAMLLAKDLELGAVTVVNSHVALRHVILSCGCSKSLVLTTARVLAQNAKQLAPAVITRPSRPLMIPRARTQTIGDQVLVSSSNFDVREGSHEIPCDETLRDVST